MINLADSTSAIKIVANFVADFHLQISNELKSYNIDSSIDQPCD